MTVCSENFYESWKVQKTHSEIEQTVMGLSYLKG